MAEVVTFEGQQYKVRSPLGVWGLSIITVGIYWWVWYYKINDEARRYLRDEAVKPGISVLAVTLGALVIVPALVSVYRTGERIERMQAQGGVVQRVSGVLGLLAYFVVFLHVPYYQENLNKVWRQTTAAAPPAPAPPPGPVAPPA